MVMYCMKNTIVVKKNKAQRAGMWFLLGIFVCAATAVCLLWFPVLQSSALLFCVLLVPVILYVFLMALFYQIWQVSFGPIEITIRRLFFGTKSYTYVQISDVYAANSYTLHEHIHIAFSDGKKIVIRMEDENADAARKIIQSHRSIRSLNW